MNKYGIQTEQSHIRAHVSPTTRSVYVYKTQAGIAAITRRRYRKVPAYQPGYAGPTAFGFLVPPEDISDLRTIPWRVGPIRPWWHWFNPSADTSDKGAKAVQVVCLLLANGMFPLWVAADEVDDLTVQISGTDIVACGRWRIQVKCDFKAGPKSAGGTGNLFLQVEEINPLGKY